MDWRDRTKGQAKFRGVPFHVATAEFAGGRRTVKHQFPGRDTPFVEDMGREGRSFPVEGYVIGPAYLAQRDALIAALEAEGPGELIHPYYGTRWVSVAGPFRVRESRADGGMATFAIDFDETQGDPSFPVAVPDPQAQVAAAATAADLAVAAEFAAVFGTDGEAPAYLESLSALVRAAATGIGGALAPVVRGTQQLAAFKRAMDRLGARASSLVRDPVELVAGVGEALLALDSDALAPGAGVSAVLAAYTFGSTTARPVGTTASRLKEQANFDALQRLVQRQLIIHAARLAPFQTYAAYEDAVAVRDAIAELVDDQAELAGDDAYPALVQLRADLVRALPAENSGLAHLVRHTPAVTVPSLVLAHRLYGDLNAEGDILARNRVRHPGFVVGGRQLEVLSRA